jgi:jumonji domain-containing protein 7
MEEKIEELWREIREMSLGNNGNIERLESPPTPIQFLKNFITPNKPCIISNSITHWPSLSLWTNPSYLTQTLSSTTVSLHLTPTGAADSLTTLPSSSSLCFASARVQRVSFPEALNLINSSNPSKCVAYAQQQNDCFRSEYSSLAQDCDSDIPWATEAFGSEPEAVNLWIGNRYSYTSFHKDHYENLYAVVCGEKRFLLFPPTDVHRFYIRQYPAATYSYSSV